MKPHKHAEVIKAWADGKQVQWQDSVGTWRNVNEQFPIWCANTAFRVKPETIRYRVALLEKFVMVADDDNFAADLSDAPSFVRWLTDWIEVEV